MDNNMVISLVRVEVTTWYRAIIRVIKNVIKKAKTRKFRFLNLFIYTSRSSLPAVLNVERVKNRADAIVDNQIGLSVQ